MRGARDHHGRHAGRRGIIPACAGSTLPPTCRGWRAWDHPRMCGEHGNRLPCGRPKPGSSPHVRGARGLTRSAVRLCGIIPACAGSTTVKGLEGIDVWDHPRMCGEHDMSYATVRFGRGSSPHVRGARPLRTPGGWRRGIIPACAGSTLRK